MNTFTARRVTPTREQRLLSVLAEIRTLAEAWADPDVGDQIIALVDRHLT